MKRLFRYVWLVMGCHWHLWHVRKLLGPKCLLPASERLDRVQDRFDQIRRLVEASK